MRLFIAINFSDNTRNRLAALRDELKARSRRGNFTLSENLHLTLAFIGECNPKQTDIIKEIIDTVEFAPFEAVINRLGNFARGTIWWVGLEESAPLMELQSEIARKLADCGFEQDTRRYSPHITLGREVATDAEPWRIEPVAETVSAVDLMKSERIGGKLTYTAVYTRKAVGG